MEKKLKINMSKASKIKMMICICCGTLCLAYFLMIFFSGLGGGVNLIWLAGSIFFFLCSILIYKQVKFQRKWRIAGYTFFVLAFAFAVLTEGLVISGFSATAKKEADYIIVLGNTVLKSGPSKILKERLDTAAEVAIQSPDAILVVAGGQGEYEPVAEGVAMKEYLMEEHGIAGERILVDGKSMNTFENLTFSLAILEENIENFNIEQSQFTVVTSNFHMYRALKSAKKVGIINVEGQAAPSYLLLLPQNMLREMLAIVKNTVLRRM